MKEPTGKKVFDIGRTLPARGEGNRVSSRTTPVQPPDNGPRPKSWQKIVAIAGLYLAGLVVLFGLTIAGWDYVNISRASQKMFHTSNLFNMLGSGGLDTGTDGRINVLIAGYSVDDPGHSGAQLTDSIMLLSLNPATRHGYMLSIPRDLYVNLGSQNCRSGGQYCKINEAYEDGGMPLLKKTIQRDFGTPIDYYALVNYGAVRDIVNAVGGIDVNINNPDGRLFDPNKDWTTGGPLVDLSNGEHHLSGQQALDLTRARGDYPNPYGVPVGFEQSDFTRTANQRLVLTAIKKKLNWRLVLNPVKNGRILMAVASNVQTDMPADQVRPIFGLFNSIPNAQLKSLSLRDLNGNNYLSGYSSYYAGSALVPSAGIDDYSQIDAALSQIN